MKNIIKFLVVLLLFNSCEDLFEPAIENTRGLDAMHEEPLYAQGILGNAYILLPYSSTPSSDVATDDAVTNNNSDAFLSIASGSWAANNNPLSRWQASRNAIQYLNIFLENTDNVNWSNIEIIRTMYNDRLKGEAYGLRAVHMFFLLMAHGGRTPDGKLLGIPIVTSPENAASDFNRSRNTYQECVDQILSDAAMAIDLLPVDYGDISDGQIPQKYQSLGVKNAGDYNRVNGNHIRGRITGRIVEAVRAQVALLAASPAYSDETTVTWQDAANYAAVVLDRINGVSGIDLTGGTWYVGDRIEGLAAGATPAEIIWRSDIGQSLDLERENFPFSAFGNGRINPTQNLVDAFPMANGYPITHQDGNFDPANPYVNRDPRLNTYIVVNESQQGPNNNVIVTGTYGDNNDVINRESGKSTRTGYYMRKLLRYDCNPAPKFNTEQKHYTARIRYTEIFLNYAEAANEAWGPTNAGSHGYSAYDVIKAIRLRAGVGIDNNDAYLESIKNDKDKMRELIRNERRLELCFENHRFLDLRRWKVSLDKLNETARGVQIDKVNDVLTYTPIDVETRNYKDYMYYGPIPYGEILKWSNLVQNAGW